MPFVSPYDGIPVLGWATKTRELIDAHPLRPEELTEVTLQAWDGIFKSSIGDVLRIGPDISFPQQVMGMLLDRLIAYWLSKRHPDVWHGGMAKDDKDLVYVPDTHFSIEIKSSTHATSIFANRSYAQPPTVAETKSKNGYYLAVNCQAFTSTIVYPRIVRIRFGWLDHTDWVGQKSPTGQQASLTREANMYKLLSIYTMEK